MASFWDRILGKDSVDVNSESYLNGKKQEFSRQRQAYRRMQAEGKMYDVDAALRALDEREQQIDRRMRELEDQGYGSSTRSNRSSGSRGIDALRDLEDYVSDRMQDFQSKFEADSPQGATYNHQGSGEQRFYSNTRSINLNGNSIQVEGDEITAEEFADQIRAQMWGGDLPEDRDTHKPETQYNNYGGGVQINVNRWDNHEGDQNIVRGKQNRWD